MTSVFLSVGDASGDALAAAFVTALRRLRPDCRFVGMGGSEMEKAGVELAVPQEALAVGGLFELAGQLRRIVSTWNSVNRSIDACHPDLVVLVDSGGFNLPLARRVKRRHAVPILYLAAPQVWAWRRGRIGKLARRVDRLAVIFPFEPAVYAETGLQVDFVGHPLAAGLDAVASTLTREAACRELGLDPERRWIALLPGSRRNEIRHQLPLQLAAARVLHERRPELGFAIAQATSIDSARITDAIAEAKLPAGLIPVRIAGRTHNAIRAADVVLAKPGTSTVEVTFLRRPMVVMGRANRLTALALKWLVQVPFLAMPNLIAGREIVPELMQDAAQPEALADAVEALLDGPARERQLEDLAEVARVLRAGSPLASSAVEAAQACAPEVRTAQIAGAAAPLVRTAQIAGGCAPALRTAEIAEEMLGAGRA